MKTPKPWYLTDEYSLEEFITGMLEFGKPVEVSLVGVFDSAGRGSRCDVEMQPHHDGGYTKIEGQPRPDYVGLYCIREGEYECITEIYDPIKYEKSDEVNLKRGEALIFDNNRIAHARRGKVGSRLLLRVWIVKHI